MLSLASATVISDGAPSNGGVSTAAAGRAEEGTIESQEFSLFSTIPRARGSFRPFRSVPYRAVAAVPSLCSSHPRRSDPPAAFT